MMRRSAFGFCVLAFVCVVSVMVQLTGAASPVQLPLPSELESTDPATDSSVADAIRIEYVSGTVQRIHEMDADEVNAKAADEPDLYPELMPGEILQLVEVKLTSGERAGDIIDLRNIASGQLGFDVPLEPGARILLRREATTDGTTEFNIADRERAPVLGLLLGLTMLALVYWGGKPGLKTLLLLLALLAGGNFLVMDLTLNGMSVYLTSAVVCWAFLYGATYVYWGESENGKWVFYTALDGVLSVGILILVASLFAPLDGRLSEALGYFTEAYPQVSLFGLYFASTLVVATSLMFYVTHGLVREVSQELNQHIDSGQTAGVQKTREQLARELGAHRASVSVLCLTGVFVGILLPYLFQWMEIPLTKLINLEIVVSYGACFLAILLGCLLITPLAANYARLIFKAD